MSSRSRFHSFRFDQLFLAASTMNAFVIVVAVLFDALSRAQMMRIDDRQFTALTSLFSEIGAHNKKKSPLFLFSRWEEVKSQPFSLAPVEIFLRLFVSFLQGAL